MTTKGYEESYLGQLRKLVGREKIIIVAARAVVMDENENILIIRRRDNGRWAMPAGAMELDESIYDCLVREVHEESGLHVHAAELISIWSDPDNTSIVTEYGDPYQLVVFVFYIQKWSGDLIRETDETIDAGFFPQVSLPEIAAYYHQTLEDLKTYQRDKKVILR